MENNPFEKAPSIYEQLLQIAKQMREQGINPFESADFTRHSNPAVVELWDKYNEWVASLDFSARGNIRTVEKAEGVARAAMFWIEAGYTNKEVIKETLDMLVVEEEDAQKIPNNEEATQILTDTVEKLENLLQKQERGDLETQIEQVQAEAEEKAVAGDFMSATRLLTSMLVNPRYQRIFKKNPELRVEIDKRANEFSAEFKRIRYKK